MTLVPRTPLHLEKASAGPVTAMMTEQYRSNIVIRLNNTVDNIVHAGYHNIVQAC